MVGWHFDAAAGAPLDRRECQIVRGAQHVATHDSRTQRIPWAAACELVVGNSLMLSLSSLLARSEFVSVRDP